LLHSADCFIIIFSAPFSFATFFLKWDSVTFQCWLNQCCMGRWKLPFCFYSLLFTWRMIPFVLFTMALCWKFVLICFPFVASKPLTEQFLCRPFPYAEDLTFVLCLYLYNFSFIKACYVQKGPGIFCPMTQAISVMSLICTAPYLWTIPPAAHFRDPKCENLQSHYVNAKSR